VASQADIDLELVDSLYHYFLLKQTYKANTYQIFGCKKFKLAPSIDVSELEATNIRGISLVGEQLLKEGRVCLFVMMAGHS